MTKPLPEIKRVPRFGQSKPKVEVAGTHDYQIFRVGIMATSWDEMVPYGASAILSGPWSKTKHKAIVAWNTWMDDLAEKGTLSQSKVDALLDGIRDQD